MKTETPTEQQLDAWFEKLENIAFNTEPRPQAIRINISRFCDMLNRYQDRLDPIVLRGILQTGYYANLYEKLPSHADIDENTKKCEIWVQKTPYPFDILIGRPEKCIDAVLIKSRQVGATTMAINDADTDKLAVEYVAQYKTHPDYLNLADAVEACRNIVK